MKNSQRNRVSIIPPKDADKQNLNKRSSTLISNKIQQEIERNVILVDKSGGGVAFSVIVNCFIFDYDFLSNSSYTKKETAFYDFYNNNDFQYVLPKFYSKPIVSLKSPYKFWWKPTYRIKNFATVAVNDYIYIIGGFNISHRSAIDRMMRYSFVTDTWDVLQPMKIARFNHAAVFHRNFLVVTGGEKAEGKYTSSCEKYDILKDEWASYSNLPYFVSNHSIISHQDKYLIVSGGVFRKKMLDDIIIYENASWNYLDRHCPVKMNTKRQNHNMAFFDGQLIFIGGKLDSNSQTIVNIESLTLDIKLDKAILSMDIVSPSNIGYGDLNKKSYNSGIFQIGQYAISFGGTNQETNHFIKEIEIIDLINKTSESSITLPSEGNYSNLDCVEVARVYNNNDE